jgi:hypothetical protein
MALDRHEQLVLCMRQADPSSLLLAPVLEAAQFDPEGQEIFKILSGWLNGITLLTAEFTATISVVERYSLLDGRAGAVSRRRKSSGLALAQWRWKRGPDMPQGDTG